MKTPCCKENVIIKLLRGERQGDVTVTTSSDTRFSDVELHAYSFRQIVHEGDVQRFIHIPTAPTHAGVLPARFSLDDLGLQVSTGPVVDFRLKEFLRAEPAPGTAPLLYPTHFSGGELAWPRASKKPNALLDVPETQKWLYPSGFYTVVRRFSSKEERRRLVAHVVDPAMFHTTVLGFENHLNVFHSCKQGIARDTAYGLSTFLNSTAVDQYFRRFSGHTQVNATDLRLLRYPAMSVLTELGQWARGSQRLSQEQIDDKVEALLGRGQQDR